MSGGVALAAGSIGNHGGRCIRGDLDINSWQAYLARSVLPGAVGAVGSGSIGCVGAVSAGDKMPIAERSKL